MQILSHVTLYSVPEAEASWKQVMEVRHRSSLTPNSFSGSDKVFFIPIFFCSIRVFGNFATLTIIVVSIQGCAANKIWSNFTLLLKLRIEFFGRNHRTSKFHNCYRRIRTSNQQCGCNWAQNSVKHEFFRVDVPIWLLLESLNESPFQKSWMEPRRHELGSCSEIILYDSKIEAVWSFSDS